ncbi:MAG: hypothetical protein D6734_05610 [Candidatus Schekmanbacteria bacterium]|nr:MAG: hypothetical protein D6734_05610 [Candidatus Schekmanbacteria bacterium]
MKRMETVNRFTLTLFYVFIILLFNISAHALTPEEILRNAIRKKGMQNFSGISRTVSFIKSKECMAEARVYFRRPGMCRMEHMRGIPPDKVLITKNNEILSIDYRQRKVYKTKITSSANDNESKEKLLLKNYSPFLKGEEKIAGRKAYVIEVKSRLKGRPSKLLWIDKENFAILSSKTFSCGGKLKTSVVFSEVDFHNEPPEKKFLLPEGFKVVTVEQRDRKIDSVDELSKKVEFDVKLPEKLPEGFVFDGFFLYRCNCGVNMAHIRYFDGLAGISIFEGPRDCPKCGEGFSWRRRIGMRNNDTCTKEECELTGQKWENIRTFLDDTRRFIVIADISDDEMELIKNELLRK